jgi:hypothetical protein
MAAFFDRHSALKSGIIHSFIFFRSQLRTQGPFRGFVITHTIKHTIALLWTSDLTVAEASTYTGQHNI